MCSSWMNWVYLKENASVFQLKSYFLEMLPVLHKFMKNMNFQFKLRVFLPFKIIVKHWKTVSRQ